MSSPPLPFKTVFFDITSGCTARCPYCLTGANPDRSNTAITVDRFARTLDVLRKAKLIGQHTLLGLYNWGEPFLHPDLNGILDVASSAGLRYMLSTNASVPCEITQRFVRNLHSLRISMCGFSQTSYDRIHRLPFDVVKGTIAHMVRDCRAAAYKGTFEIAYHVYQFNIHEMAECERFADKHGIAFNPYYAILNEWWLLQGWLRGTLSLEKMRTISEDLFMFDVREQMRRAPSQYVCPQYDLLVIDEKSNVVACCQVPKEREFLCGNVLEDDPGLILRNKRNREVCIECTRSGLAYYLNNSLVCPAFYCRNRARGFLSNATEALRRRLLGVLRSR